MRNSIKNIKITQSSSEPITRDEAKKQCIADHTIDDDYIDELIIRCRKELESICGISIVETSIELIADWHLEQQLPNGPVTEVTEVQYKASAVSEYQPLAEGTDYFIDEGLFNSLRCGRHKITYTCGYDEVPENLKGALLNLIAFRYQNRGDHEVELSDDVRQQILQFKDYSWA